MRLLYTRYPATQSKKCIVQHHLPQKGSSLCPPPPFIAGAKSSPNSSTRYSPASSSLVTRPCLPASCSPGDASSLATLTRMNNWPLSCKALSASTSTTAPPTSSTPARSSSSPPTFPTPPLHLKTPSIPTSSPRPARIGSTRTTATSAESF